VSLGSGMERLPGYILYLSTSYELRYLLSRARLDL
jgi:hypothetical protein